MKIFWIVLFSSSCLLFSCPFCPPQVEKQLFLEEGSALGICTNRPIYPGHVLIIPKRHVERFEELTNEELVDIGVAIQRVHQAAQELFGQNDYLLLQKNGKAAGQSVFHVHFHYYPRSEKISTLGFLWRFLVAPYRAAKTTAETEEEISMWKKALFKQ